MQHNKVNQLNVQSNNLQIFMLFTCEFITIIAILTTFYSVKKDIFLPIYELFGVIIFFIWIITSLLAHKFNIKRNQNYIETLVPFLKSQFFLITVVAIMAYLLKLPGKFILWSLAVFSGLEILLVTACHIYQKPVFDENIYHLLPTPVIDYEAGEEVVDEPEPQRQPYEIPDSIIRTVSLREKLEKIFLINFPNIFNFINAVINIDKIDLLKAVSYYTSNPYNIEILEDGSMSFIMNLQVVNNFRWMNQYFIEANKKLAKGGILIGRFESIEQRKQRLFNKYPIIILYIFFMLDFAYKRICPKLPYIKKVYFSLSKGKNRVISKAECLGRLYSCGFELLALKEIDNHFYFIANKSKAPVSNQIPSYGPIFKQRRIGKDGRIVYIYKVRTMYPFSEFLHRYMIENNNFKENGKIRDDFRITGWGKAFRKFWIDEIPMIFNLLKGDLKLIGVRPLSETFFNMYPSDLQKLRTRFKPGLVPPFYVDLPNCLEEVWKSEYNYLKQYNKSPIKTDVIYFIKAVYNIIFRHARSG